MELFLPSLFTLVIVLAIVFGIFPGLRPLTLAIFAAACLAFALKNHYDMFAQEYKSMTWTTGATAAAPYVLVGVVILFAIGYLLFLFGSGKKVEMGLPAATIPPPETATNVLTNAIGNGLKAAGLANVKELPKNIVSVSPSLKNNLTNSEIRSILESRLNKQV